MSNKAQTENAGASIDLSTSENTSLNMSINHRVDANTILAQTSMLSPPSAKARSLPSTPSQRPRSPIRPKIEGSPQLQRTVAGRTPTVFTRGIPCKYETGMKQARRRMPYTLGPEKLDADSEAAAKRPNPNEEARLTSEMGNLYQQLLPTEESESRRRSLVQKLEQLLRNRWPGREVKVSVFGSTGNQLGTSTSDVDICITTDCKEIEHVCFIADLLAKNGMEQVVCVSSAKVPIVKVWDPDLQVACDMNVNNPIALENTELIRSYVAIDDRFRPLAMIVKHWAKRRILNDAALGGTLSSYTWICLVLNFLQTRKPPILPSLQNVSGLKPHLLSGVNVAFNKDLSKYDGYGKANTSSLGQLLFQFFHYYAHDFDFGKGVVSVRLGQVVQKSQKAWHLLQDNMLCVEEPFNISRNLGNTADDTSVRGIHLELRRACGLVAAGKLQECCEQYMPPQADPLPRRPETFIQPTTKAIIPQLPPQPQPQPTKPTRNGYKNARRSDRVSIAGRRPSNATTRPATHLRDLPFQMNTQELQLQAQHQQHLLHDQLYQQYQYLQLQEAELRLQLNRHRGLVAASGQPPEFGFSGNGMAGDVQELSRASRSNTASRTPLTAPLYQARFNNSTSLVGNGFGSSGIITNPASPLLATSNLDSRRYARRASVNNAAANTMRAHSQPARGLPAAAMLPYLTQRPDIPVRQVDPLGTRRSSIMSNPRDSFAAQNSGHSSSHGTRYDAGRRPVEYIGYYVGDSPSLSAHPGSTTISPIPSSAGLAIHNGGLSPRVSTRSSRLPSVSTSPASHYTSVINGARVTTPLVENVPTPFGHAVFHSPPSRTGPLIVDGSVTSPPRRQPGTRPARSVSEELDISVTTSEDAVIDTPSSSDELSNHAALGNGMINGHSEKPLNGDGLQDRGYLSLNGTSSSFADGIGFDDTDSSSVLRKLEEERNIRTLTNALAAATVDNGPFASSHARRPQQSMSVGLPGLPLIPVANGHHIALNASAPPIQEWQTQTGKKKNKNKKRGAKNDVQDKAINFAGGETLPANEAMRKGG